MTREEFLATLRLRDVLNIAQAAANACGGAVGFSAPADEAQSRVRDEALEVAEAALARGRTQLDVEALRGVGALVRSDADVAPVARGLLRAIDECCGERLVSAFTARRQVVSLTPGMIFPVAQVDLRGLIPNRRLRSRDGDPPWGRLRHLGIAGEHAVPAQLNLSEHVLPSAEGEFRVCVIVATPPHERFEIRHFDEHSFFGARISDEQGYQRRLNAALTAAEKARASLVILPELSSSTSTGAWLQAWFAGSKLPALFAGSAHLPDDTPRGVNRATFLSGRAVSHHDKINPFQLKAWDSVDLIPWRVEGLVNNPDRAITVHFANGTSFVFLICKDVLDQRVLARLRELRPTYLFIAAWSEGLNEFESELQSLGQTTSFVSNFSHVPKNVTALAILPTREGRVVRAYEAQTQPEIWLISLRDPTQWVRFDAGLNS